MLFSGNSFRLTPEVNQMGFIFSGLSILGTGVAEIGFSGSGNIVKFIFNNNRIKTSDGKFVGVYNVNEPLLINGSVDTGSYQFYINGDLTSNRKTKPNFQIQRFFVNTTGAAISSNVKLSCKDIAPVLSINTGFLALDRLSGFISNASDSNYRVFGSNLSFYGPVTSPISGNITGSVIANSTGLSFSFQDLNTSRFDSSLKFLLSLDTSIGGISGLFTSNRVSGLDYASSDLISSSGNILFSGLFDGSGLVANRFVFVPTPQAVYINYSATSTTMRGDSRNKVLTAKIEPYLPADNTYIPSSYVTGFTLVTGGEYMVPPRAMFTGYYYVNDLNWNLNSIILSSGCSGSLLVTYSGINGEGRNASGLLLTAKTYLSGVYDSGVNSYYLPYDYQLVSGGTGYLQPAKAILNTGLYSNCYDVASKYGYSYSIFTPFSGYSSNELSAGYLTGEVLCRTGLVSGGQRTGYIVTGLEITNQGSGFSSGLFPKMSFIRATGDTLISGASGVFTMKQTGLYSFSGNWSLSTGISNQALIPMSGLTGTMDIPNDKGYVTVKVGYSGNDFTSPVVAKMTMTMTSGDTIIHYITGVRYFDTTTGFLKKKDNLTLSTIPASAELSFSLTQSDLDNYYSSSEFINNSFVINVGDLDF